jgi:hypothetical protein
LAPGELAFHLKIHPAAPHCPVAGPANGEILPSAKKWLPGLEGLPGENGSKPYGKVKRPTGE